MRLEYEIIALIGLMLLFICGIWVFLTAVQVQNDQTQNSLGVIIKVKNSCFLSKNVQDLTIQLQNSTIIHINSIMSKYPNGTTVALSATPSALASASWNIVWPNGKYTDSNC